MVCLEGARRPRAHPAQSRPHHAGAAPALRCDREPVLFSLLFVYVFGSGVPIQGGSYKDFAIAGLMLLNLTTSAMGTAVGLVSDLTTGAIDRFRTLPIWRSAVLVSRSVADLLSAALCISIVALTGLCIGWRPVRGPPRSGRIRYRPPLQLRPLVGVRVPRHRLEGARSAQGIGLIILFPLAIVSNALVPTTGMPGWLQAIADWNPVSAVTAAVRTSLVIRTLPAISAWPMQHPVEAAVAWSVAILVVFAPLAAHLFRRRTTG